MKKSIFLLLLLACFIITCQNKPTGPKPVIDDNPGIAQETIGPEGGVIQTNDFIMQVPAGAFGSSANLKLFIETEEQAFGEGSVSPLYRLEGMPAENFASIQIKFKYQGPLSEVHYIAVGVQDSVDYNDSTYAVIKYNYFDAIESDGFLTGEILMQQSGENNIFKSNDGNDIIDFFLGAMTAKNPDEWNPFSDHFKITGYIHETESANADEIMSLLEQAYVRFQNANFDFYNFELPLEVSFSPVSDYAFPIAPIMYINRNNTGFIIFYPLKKETDALKATDAFHILVDILFLDYIMIKHFTFSENIRHMVALGAGLKYGYGYTRAKIKRSAIENCISQFIQQKYQYILFDYLIRLQGDKVLSIFCRMYESSGDQLASIIDAAGPPAEWLIGYYIYMTAYNELYMVTGPDFWEGKCAGTLNWDAMNDTEELTHSYPDLSAAWYKIDLSSNMTENTSLKLSVNSSQADIAVMKYKSSEIEYMDNSIIDQSELVVSDLKSIADDGYDLLVIACNHNTTPALSNKSVLPINNSDITLTVEKMEQRFVTNCNIHLQDIHVNTIIHYDDGDQSIDRYHFLHFNSDPDFNHSFANGVFYQSFQNTKEDGTMTDFTMKVKFNKDLTKILSFTVEQSDVLESAENPLYSYARYDKLSGTNIDIDPSGTNQFKVAGAEVCESITELKISNVSTTTNWELTSIADCVHQTDLVIQINQ